MSFNSGEISLLEFKSEHHDWSCAITEGSESRLVIRIIRNAPFYCDSLVFGQSRNSDIDSVLKTLRQNREFGIVEPIIGRNVSFGKNRDNFVLVLRTLTKSGAPSTISKYAFKADVSVTFPLIDDGQEQILAVGSEDNLNRLEKLCEEESGTFIENQEYSVLCYKSYLEKVYRDFCDFLGFTEQEMKVFLVGKMFGLDIRLHNERLLKLATEYLYNRGQDCSIERRKVSKQAQRVFSRVFESLWLVNKLMKEFYSERHEQARYLCSL